MPGQTNGYTTAAGGARFAHNVGSRIQGSVSVSYSSLAQEVKTVPGYSGLTYEGDLSYKVSSRLIAHANAARSTVPSDRIGANFSINDEYQADITYNLGSRINLKLLGSSRLHNYKGAPSQTPVDLTREVADSISFDANYKINRRFDVGLIVTEQRRTANFPGLTYTGTTVELQTKAVF